MVNKTNEQLEEENRILKRNQDRIQWIQLIGTAILFVILLIILIIKILK